MSDNPEIRALSDCICRLNDRIEALESVAVFQSHNGEFLTQSSKGWMGLEAALGPFDHNDEYETGKHHGCREERIRCAGIVNAALNGSACQDSWQNVIASALRAIQEGK